MSQIGNSELIRDLNVGRILKTIHHDQPISRVRLAETTGLSFPTVSRIVNGLRRKQFLIEESEGLSTGGRRPTLLRLNPEAGYVIGVDVDVADTSIALLDLTGQIVHSATYSVHLERGPDALVDVINQYMEKTLREKNLDKKKALGIGVAIPGQVDPVTGVLILASNLGWKNVPLKALVDKKTGIRSAIEGDVGAMTLGEHLFGVARETQNLAWVGVGGGVGVGLIQNGNLYRGEYGSAGEIGHITVMRDGPDCFCGKKGCLETMVGTAAVLSRLVKAIARGKETLISDLVRGRFEDLRICHLFQAARQKDKLAELIVEDMAYYLGIGLSTLANLLDPGLIVVGGPVIESGGEKFFEMVKKFTAEAIIPSRVNRLVIKRSGLGEQVGVIGAGSLIYQEGLKSPLVV